MFLYIHRLESLNVVGHYFKCTTFFFSHCNHTELSFTPKIDCFICLIHVFIFGSLTLLCQVLIVVHVNIIHIPQMD